MLMIGYIIEVEHDLFVCILINQYTNPIVYANSSIITFAETNDFFNNFSNPIEIVTENIPETIKEWANKIFMIKKGFDQDTSNIPLDFSDYTVKQIQVIKTALQIPVNEIWPYSKVAELANLPKAQRFVGSTMKLLRQPYIVPVQRVKSLSFLRTKNKKINKRKMPL